MKATAAFLALLATCTLAAAQTQDILSALASGQGLAYDRPERQTTSSGSTEWGVPVRAVDRANNKVLFTQRVRVSGCTPVLAKGERRTIIVGDKVHAWSPEGRDRADFIAQSVCTMAQEPDPNGK